jgi:hypothetical protein
MFKKNNELKDKTLIFCTNKNEEKNKILNKHTKIYGGKDSYGEDIIFETDDDLLITGLTIKTVQTLLYSEIIVDKNNLPNSNIEVATYNMDEVYRENQRLYLFSKKYSNASVLSKTKDLYPFSFIFVSSLFYLKEGERTICIKFYPVKESLNMLLETLKTLNLFIKDDEKTLDLFCSILYKSVIFKYTTENNLVSIDKKNIIFKWNNDDKSFDINIKITIDMPMFSIEQCNDININIPYLQMELYNIDLLWVFILFYFTSFYSIKISTDVKNFKDLILQNDFGVIEKNVIL